jgi:O-antigen/teichoic acid export membrane protein
MVAPVAQVGGYFRYLQHKLKGRDRPALTEGYLARAAAGSMVIRVCALGLVFVSQLLLARSLGAHAYGLYAYALAWLKTLTVPATLGLERLLVREVATYHARSDWASWRGLLIWAGRMLLGAATGLTLVAVVVSWFIARSGEGLQVFWLAIAALPLIALLRLKQFVMQGMHRTIIGQVPESLVQPLILTTLLVTYFACVGRLTATGAMSLNLAAMCAALACGVVLSERILPAAVKESAPKMHERLWLRSVLPLLLVSGVNSMSGQIPVLMLGALRNAEAAGILSVARRLADLTTLPILALSAVLTPTLAALWATRDMRGIQRTMTKCARGVTLVSVPIALILIIAGRPLLAIFGVPFTAGASALALLCVGQIINVLVGSNGLLLVLAGHEREAAFISTTCALLNCGLCAALISSWGMWGAAVGATASLIIWNLWLAWRVWRRLGIRPTIWARLDERQSVAS